jgi:Tfp pilus assembly protein PilF
MAQEVADVLQAEGYQVKVQDYDFPHGGRFVLDIHEALKQARHLLILHTEDYDASFWTQQEFANFLAAVARSKGERRIGLLRCDRSTPLGLFEGITFGDLVGVQDPAERRRIILKVARGEPTGTRPAPRIFGGTMPPENRLFTGREDLLQAMHTALAAEGGAALTQVALCGLGGVGKTAAARAYVERQGGDYAGVWWITAADRTSLLTGLDGLAHALDPNLPAETKLEETAQAALRRVERAGAPLLLVCDNLPSPEVLEGLVPARGARVLITSRWQDWGGWAAELSVAVMREDEATAFLQRRAGRQDEPGAKGLAQVLGCLPLALDHAGAYVKRALIGFDDYARQVEALLGTTPRGAEYPASVAATFTLAIEAAAQQSPAAERLLGLFAWLAPDRIPLLLVDEGMLPASERAAGLEALGSVSLVMPGPAAEGGPTVSVHRLVQAVMRARLAAQSRTEVTRTAALDRLAVAFPGGAYRDPSGWPLCRVLMPHVEVLLVRLGAEDASAALGGLLNNAGGFLLGQGILRQAEAYFRRALQARERVLGPEHPNTLTSVNNLAFCLQAKGDAIAAEPLYRRALQAREQVLGPQHPDTLTSVNNLAGCLQAQGDFTAAEPLFRRTLEAQERLLGPEHPSTLTSVNNLAECLRVKGDLAAAEPLLRRALQACEQVLGPEHPDTLTSVNNLALCLQAKGDITAAEPLYRHALAGAERVLGPNHPTTVLFRSNLDDLLRRKRPS